jgi:hypothetical protein
MSKHLTRSAVEFPISSEEDGFVTRREFTKFLGLASIGFFAGTCIAAVRKLWKRSWAMQTPGLQVATLQDLGVGEYKLFRYPTENDPCILLRLGLEKFVAYNQSARIYLAPLFSMRRTGNWSVRVTKVSSAPTTDESWPALQNGRSNRWPYRCAMVRYG